MPVPKQRVGKSDKRHRRSNWKALPTAVTFCVNCGSPKLTHAVCTVCGFYNGRIVSPRFAKKSGYDQVQSRMEAPLDGLEDAGDSVIDVAGEVKREDAE
ncbi:MAG: 50S ribosomal protein L32 [Vampirovibrio sp.]